MVKNRTAETGRQVVFDWPNAIGRQVKLKNRRVILAHDGNRYFVKFRHLTDEGKICDLKFVVSPEAMFALIALFRDIKGPLPAGIERDDDGEVVA